MINILTQVESNEVTRDHHQMDFCAIPENVILINSYLPFKKTMAGIKTQVEIIEGKEAAKDASHIGTTAGKMSLKMGFADYETILMNKAHAYALDPDNRTPETTIAMDQLADDMNLRRDQIISMRDADIFGLAEKIKTKISPYLIPMNAQGYEITAAQLDEGVAKATLFKNSIGATSVIESNSIVASTDIHIAYEKILALQRSLKLNLTHWNVLNPDFVTGMKAASVIDHLGHSFTILRGNITGGPDNVPLPNATIQNLRNGRYADVNILAQYEMKKFHAHLDNWEILCTGYHGKIVPIKTEAGKAVVMNFHLDPL